MKTMSSNLLCILIAGLLACTVLAVRVDAAPNPPADPITVVGSSGRDLSGLPTQTAQAQGGNVTEINIQSIAITKSWQGYYGNISGLVTLQNSAGATFYNWTLTSFKGRVFASRANTIAWTTVNCSSAQNRTLEEAYLNQSPTDSDSVTRTFNQTSHSGFNVATQAIVPNTCYSTNGYVNNNTQSSNFQMLLLSPSNGDIVYTALTNQSTVGFDGNQHDFELLVGENQKTGNLGVTTYYFWTEFD